MRKLSKRDKRTLIGGGVLVFLYVIVFHLIMPLYDAGTSLESELGQKKRILQGAVRTLRDRDVLATQLAETERVLGEYQERLLDAQDPTMAATQLDEIVRNLANENGVTLTKSNPLQERKVGERYSKVTVQINLDADLASTKDFLYALSVHRKFLLVEDFTISKFRRSSQLQPRMNVSAFIRLS